MKEAIVLDLGDLGAQAVKIRMRAEAQAQTIIAKAEAEAEALSAEREQAAKDRGYAEGLAEGLEEGRVQGRAEALAAGQEELARLTAAWSSVATQWEQDRVSLERDARESVLRFAVGAAEKVVHRAIKTDPDTVTRQVAAALERVLTNHDIAVRVHPEDRPVIDEALPHLVAELTGLGHVTLVDDNTVGRGGCALSVGSGQLDASISTQLERIAELVLPGAGTDQMRPGIDDADTAPDGESEPGPETSA